MKIRILGSAAGGGFPQWNCNCENCHGVRAGSPHLRARTQSSIALSDDQENWVLFNASPDILTQLQRAPVLQPARRIRDTGIRAVVLIDAQVDHTTGLLMLRESSTPLPVFCTEPVREDLTTGNPIFSVLSHYGKVDWHPLRFADQRCAFSIPGIEGVSFSAYPLKSKAPPYSPHREDPHPGDTIGILAENLHTGKKLFYAPGLGELEPHVRELMAQADCVLVDGTFWKDDEMIALGVSQKRAREIGHLPQSGPGGMIEVFASLPQARKILIHLNNTNPVLNESSPERAILNQAGIEVAFDGMEIDL